MKQRLSIEAGRLVHLTHFEGTQSYHSRRRPTAHTAAGLGGRKLKQGQRYGVGGACGLHRLVTLTRLLRRALLSDPALKVKATDEVSVSFDRSETQLL